MATRNEWDSYKLQDGLNIWGAPSFLGIPTFAGGFTLGDVNTDTLVLKGRISTMSLTGDYIDIDASYTYGELAELRAQVTNWTFGNEFKLLYTRLSANLDNASGYLQGVSFISRAESGIDLYGIRSAIFEVNLRAGDQTITYVRGAEICISSPAIAGDVTDDTVTITDLRILQLENQLNTDVVPTTQNIGLWFESGSASGANAAAFHEIRMAAGLHILSGVGVPGMTAPQGSLYLRTAGTGGADRAYINTDGGTTWTNITCAG